MRSKFFHSMTTALFKDVRPWIQSVSKTEAAVWVFVLTAVSLFFELAVIRWHTSVFYALSFFKNITLLSIFLGLGIGYATGAKRPIYGQSLIYGMFAQCLIFFFLLAIGFHHLLENPVSELYSPSWANAANFLRKAVTVGFLVLIFLFNAVMTISTGQLISGLMGRLPKLNAYGLNLFGSLVGVLAFTLASWLWTPPPFWFALSLGVLAFVLYRAEAFPVWSMMAFVGLLALVGFEVKTNRYRIFSPYQAVTVMPVNSGQRVVLSLNGLYTQHVADLGKAAREIDTENKGLARHYDAPYLFSKSLDNVLVLGAGTGLDVAAALRMGAKKVDAVEIDPVILYLGKKFHPERPYDDSRVSLFEDDARTFLRHNQKKYHSIIVGHLDSQTVLSSMSNVRLDSFVFTVESFKEMRANLAPEGILAVSTCLHKDWVGKKIFEMLRLAFDGKSPRAFEAGNYCGVIFVASNMAAPYPVPAGTQEITSRFSNSDSPVEPATDDWPFFFMQHRSYPYTYLALICFLLLGAWGLIRSTLGAIKPTDKSDSFARLAAFFWMGAAFMLIETRSITELGLIYGNTWHVIAIVISFIMLLAALANWTVEHWRAIPNPIVFVGIISSLIVGWYLSGQATTFPTSLIALLAVLPLYFSGLLFSSELAKTREIGPALGANLFGAMFGGFLEYNSLYFGFRGLYVMSLVLYLLAFACLLQKVSRLRN